MKLKLERFHFGDDYTVGHLYVDGVLQCFVLEDTVREVETRPVAEWKIAGRTAIPRGVYPVTITYSNRFRKPLPLLHNVPGFDGVRIHTGNYSGDTDGCLLVGASWDGEDWVSGSRAAFIPLFDKLTDALDNGNAVLLEVV